MIFLSLLVLILTLLYIFIKKKQNYWTSKGVLQWKPKFLIGELNLQASDYEQYWKFYRRLKSMGAKFGGVYFMWKPIFVPTDPELVKIIMVRKFDYFMNRFNDVPTDTDPLTCHLFSLGDEKWKNLRANLTPTFTSGKMKMMFETFLDCTISMNDIVNDHASSKTALEAKDMFSRFTIDVIGNCAFGIECNCLKNPDSEFLKVGKHMFEVDMRKLRLAMFILTPKSIVRFLKLRFLSPMAEEFLFRVVKATVEYREKHNIFRKDFMHLLLQLRNIGKVTDDEKIKDESNPGKTFLNMTEITAQCFIFFVAGFETSATTMTFALFELSQNEMLQENLRKEIREVLKKFDNKITYEAIAEMSYLDKVIKETLRKYPPLATIARVCSKPFTFPGTNITMKRDDMVQIPVIGIHMDPEYYPDPEKFDPERFTEENKAKRPPFTWIPFGEGPRICIGLRFGLLQTKVGLATIINKYSFTLNEKTQLPVEMDPGTFITSVKGGIWLNVNKLYTTEHSKNI